jgi:agmatinase
MTEGFDTYFGLDAEHTAFEIAKAVIVPAPYEATTSYGKGTKNGPAAVLEASKQVELFDDELWCMPYKVGIASVPPVVMPPVNGATKKPFHELTDAVGAVLDAGKFPIVIGGEHSLTIGPVAAASARYPDLSILQIDAHADCRDSYEGNPYSHASVTYHLYHRLPKPVITEVGIRNISDGEVAWMEKEKPNINIYWARNQHKWNFEEIIDTLSDNVYLTIDVDGLDPGIMPSTGTPEPGGMSWQQLIDLIKLLCARKNVVAADIVELSPIANLHAPDFLAAKLLYKIIGYRFASELGVQLERTASDKLVGVL